MPTPFLVSQMETYSKVLPEFFGRVNVFHNRIRTATDVTVIGERDFRIPYQTHIGGRPGTYNPISGPIGRGNSGGVGVMIGSFFPYRMSFELDDLTIKLGDNRVQIYNAFRDIMRNGIKEFALFIDGCIHGTNDAVLGTASAVGTHAGGTKTVYTMDQATSIRRLRRGWPVIPYVNNRSAAYDSGVTRYIEQLNYNTRQVFLNALVTSPLANDKLLMDGVSGATPAGPYGLQQFVNTAVSGTTLGVDRALEQEIASVGVTAGGLPTVQKIFELQAAAWDKRGEMPNWTGYVSIQQQANLYQQVYDMAAIDLSTKAISDDRAQMKPKKQWTWGGISHEIDPRQDTDRIDYVDMSDWLRVEVPKGKVQFYTLPSGMKFFPIYDSTTASPTPVVWFALQTIMNILCINGGRQGVITGCSQPTYTA